MRGQLYYGHVNTIALVLSNGRLSTTQHFYEFVVTHQAEKIWTWDLTTDRPHKVPLLACAANCIAGTILAIT